MKQNSLDKIITYGVPVLVVGGLYLLAKPLKKLFETFDLVGTKEEEANKKEVETLEKSGVSSNYFGPRYYKELLAYAAKRNKKVNLLTVKSADALAKRIYDSVGFIQDKPEQALSAFRQLKNKSQVSFLSERFSLKYRTDLLSWMQNKFDTNSQQAVLNQIINYTKSLSSGIL